LDNGHKKTGRRKLPPDELKGSSIATRFNQADRVALEKRAASVGMAPSTFLREMALRGKIEISESTLTPEFIYEVNMIGKNLNQLTRLGNMGTRREDWEISVEETARICSEILRKGYGLDP